MGPNRNGEILTNPLARYRLGRNPGIPAAVAAIKTWTRSCLGLGEETAVSVNELACSQVGCPPRETVVLVLRTDAPALRISIHKAIADIGEPDVAEACSRGVGIVPARRG